MIVQSAVLVFCGLEICLGLPAGRQFQPPIYGLPPQFLDRDIEMDNTDAMILKNFQEPQISISAKQKHDLENFFEAQLKNAQNAQNQFIYTMGDNHHHYHHNNNHPIRPQLPYPVNPYPGYPIDPSNANPNAHYPTIPDEVELFVPPVKPVQFQPSSKLVRVKPPLTYQNGVPFVIDPLMMAPSGEMMQRMTREVMDDFYERSDFIDAMNEIKNPDMAFIEKDDAIKELAMPMPMPMPMPMNIQTNSDSDSNSSSVSSTTSSDTSPSPSVVQETTSVDTADAKPDTEKIEPATEKTTELPSFVEFDHSGFDDLVFTKDEDVPNLTWQEWLKYVAMSEKTIDLPSLSGQSGVKEKASLSLPGAEGYTSPSTLLTYPIQFSEPHAHVRVYEENRFAKTPLEAAAAGFPQFYQYPIIV